jgi:hypothetical protein
MATGREEVFHDSDLPPCHEVLIVRIAELEMPGDIRPVMGKICLD